MIFYREVIMMVSSTWDGEGPSCAFRCNGPGQQPTLKIDGGCPSSPSSRPIGQRQS